MTLLRVLARRVALGLVAAWTVLSLIFVLFNVTEDWALDRMLAMEAYGGTTPERIEEIRSEYVAERGLDRPLAEQYVDWMVNMLTLQWGESFETGQAVFPMVMEGALRTATYVVPGLVLATALGLSIGLYSATNDRSRRDSGTRSVTYLLFGVPNFWVGAMVLGMAATARMGIRWRRDFNWIETTELPFLYEYVLPTLLVTTTLLAAVVSYARAYSLQYVSTDLVKLVRAKGGNRVDVARHVVRNAAIPLLSLVFAETFALLAISAIVVEAVFGIPGLGSLFYNAVYTRDFPVVMGATLVVVAVGVAGNVFQDLSYSVLDPRVDTGTR